MQEDETSRKLCVCRLTKTIDGAGYDGHNHDDDDDADDADIDHDNDADHPQKAVCRPQLTQVVPAPMQTGRQAVYRPLRWYKMKSWKWNC